MKSVSDAPASLWAAALSPLQQGQREMLKEWQYSRLRWPFQCLQTTLWVLFFHYPHLTDEETEAHVA